MAASVLLAVLLSASAGIGGGCRSGTDAARSPVAWRVSLSSLGAPPERTWQGQPAVVGNLAIVDIATGFVALEMESGAVRWNVQPWPGRRIAGTDRLVARDGRIYVVDPVLHRAVALDTADGHTLWSVPLDTLMLLFQVDADAQALYVATDSAEIVALGVATGVERWRTSLQSLGRRNALAGVTADAGMLYVSGARKSGDCQFCTEAMSVALVASTGAIDWQRFEGDSSSDAGARPSLSVDLMLSSGVAHGMLARSRQTGTTRWRVEGAEGYVAMRSPPLVRGDTVIVADGLSLYGVRLASGALVFQTELRSSVNYIASCASRILVSRYALDVVDASTHRVLGTWLNDEYGADGFVTSGFAVSGDRAVVTTNRDIVGVRCR